MSAPEKIFMQWHGDGDPKDGSPVAESEVTWCRDRVFPEDIEYVRADAVRMALKGHSKSEILGENGLIAATMRSFSAIHDNL